MKGDKAVALKLAKYIDNPEVGERPSNRQKASITGKH